MRRRVIAIAVLACSASLSGLMAGGRVAVSAGWCGPVRPICQPIPYCPPVVYQSWSYGYQGWPYAYYPYWGSYVSSYRFSNVSPLLNYPDGAPVYRVPPPVVPTEPLIVYPQNSFGWRR